MFGIRRQEILNESQWEPRDLQLAYIEAWRYPGTDLNSPDSYRQSYLQDAEVNDWLYQRGQFVQPKNTQSGKADGAIRLLICERVGWRPLGFAMSQSSFLAVETAFKLPIGTLQTLDSNSGEHSCQFRFPPTDSQVAGSVAITIKAPQMYQLGNYGLALSHSFDTGVTLAFLHGWSLLTKTNHVSRAPMLPHAERIQELIKSTVSLWTHPLLIPVILLEEHLFRANEYMGKVLSRKTIGLESQLSVTHSGHLAGGRASFGPADLRDLMKNEEARIRLTTQLNTAITDTITFIGNIKWDPRYCQFLRHVCDQIQQFHPQTLTSSGRELKESIDALECAAASCSEHAESVKQRLELQLSVLYNFVAQADSSLTSRVAAATGLDSSAMKTLAFVTMVFLPPTFVATLFGMSIFNYQAPSQNSSSANADNGAKVVVTDFWIYWAVSVPVTLVVLVGWRIWWHYQKSYYMREYPHTKQAEDSIPNHFMTLQKWVNSFRWGERTKEE